MDIKFVKIYWESLFYSEDQHYNNFLLSLHSENLLDESSLYTI